MTFNNKKNDNLVITLCCFIPKNMIKSLQKVRLKISFDGENELLHPKCMYSNSTVKCMSAVCTVTVQ